MTSETSHEKRCSFCPVLLDSWEPGLCAVKRPRPHREPLSRGSGQQCQLTASIGPLPKHTCEAGSFVYDMAQPPPSIHNFMRHPECHLPS